MRKQKYNIVLVLLFLLFSLCACIHEKYFFQYKGVWATDEIPLSLFCQDYNGSLKIEEQTFTLTLSYSPYGHNIVLYDATKIYPNGGINGNDYLWKADTKVKNNKLYLTVTEDRISDYEGKTIVLDFYTYEEWEEKQKTE